MHIICLVLFHQWKALHQYKITDVQQVKRIDNIIDVQQEHIISEQQINIIDKIVIWSIQENIYTINPNEKKSSIHTQKMYIQKSQI